MNELYISSVVINEWIDAELSTNEFTKLKEKNLNYVRWCKDSLMKALTGVTPLI